MTSRNNMRSRKAVRNNRPLYRTWMDHVIHNASKIARATVAVTDPLREERQKANAAAKRERRNAHRLATYTGIRGETEYAVTI